MTDNATQFSSFEFKSFTSELDIEHITSSPHYPQSNGKAENAVKTVKRLFSRCRDSGYNEYLALIGFNNTPTEGVGLSPSQRTVWAQVSYVTSSYEETVETEVFDRR